jgi:hypothetical protein
MKVIDLSSAGEPEEKSGIFSIIKGILPTVNDQVDRSANNAVTSSLQRVLDNQYTVLQQVQLEGLDVPIPLVLVGPSGIWVLLASSINGVYRAKEDNWELLDEGSQHYRVAKPNLMTRAHLMARAVETYLVTRNLHVHHVEPVLVFSDPGIHVDAIRAAIRIIMVDALDRFTASLAQDIVQIDREGVQHIVDVLAGGKVGGNAGKPVEEVRDAFSFQDVPPEKSPRQNPTVIYDRSEAPILRGVPFTKSQLVVLGLLVLVDVVILGVFVVFILATS